MKCFALYGPKLLLRLQADVPTVPTEDELPAEISQNTRHTVTLDSGEVVKALRLSEPYEANGWVMIALRQSYFHLSESDYLAAGKASQILYWDEHSHFCPVCGSKPIQQTDIMKKCPKCGMEIYPPISPAIIVLIRKGDEILLVHSRNFKSNFYGLVAGFLEAGESLEECVHREVMEETGLKITNLQYFGSQPWPYPSGLMVGFTADYESGQIKLQDEELSAGAFYSLENLPEIPQKMSMARRLIDHWIEEQGRK